MARNSCPVSANPTPWDPNSSHIPMVEERSKRRLATILASDVAGFSRLMEADEDSGLCDSIRAG